MFHQSETPKSDIMNPSQIPTRASIADPTAILQLDLEKDSGVCVFAWVPVFVCV